MSKDKTIVKEGGGNAVYALGMFGAWVYFFQAANGFWEVVWAFFQGLLWPAFLVYELLKSLAV